MRPKKQSWIQSSMIAAYIILALLLTGNCPAAGPPRIGQLVMPAAYWRAAQAAGAYYGLDPCLIAGVMAIESRFDPLATNKRCRSRGLMQIEDDTGRALGLFNPYQAESNIWAGALILARLLRQTGGNVRAALRIYNSEDDGTYSNDVIAAWRQAQRSGRRAAW